MRVGSKYIVSTMWIINIVFLFGSVFSTFSGKDGQLPPVIFGVVGLFFVFFIYLVNDTIQLNRPLFIRIVGLILILSSLYYIIIGNFLITPFTLITGIFVLRNKKNG
jgi:hypothetical protein